MRKSRGNSLIWLGATLVFVAVLVGGYTLGYVSGYADNSNIQPNTDGWIAVDGQSAGEMLYLWWNPSKTVDGDVQWFFANKMIGHVTVLTIHITLVNNEVRITDGSNDSIESGMLSSSSFVLTVSPESPLLAPSIYFRQLTFKKASIQQYNAAVTGIL